MATIKNYLLYSSRQLLIVTIAVIALFLGPFMSFLLNENGPNTIEMASGIFYLISGFTLTNIDLAIMFNYSRRKIIKVQTITAIVTSILAFMLTIIFSQLIGRQLLLFQYEVSSLLDYFNLFIIMLSVSLISTITFLLSKLSSSVLMAWIKLLSMITIIWVYSIVLMLFYQYFVLNQPLILSILMILIPTIIVNTLAYLGFKKIIYRSDLCNRLQY